jgi:hypothetical protein
MTDSTTSAGWLRKSNFIEDGESPIQATIRLEVTRLHALHYLQTGVREYSQWFHCVENKVADALSRDNDRLDDELTNIFRSHCPSQVPPHFEIVPLPIEIILWLTLLLLWLPQMKELAEVHRRTTLGRRPATPNIATALVSTATISSTECPNSTNLQSWEGCFSRQSDAPLAKKSVSNTVNTVAATFRENGREDPHQDAERHVGQLLQRQLRSNTQNNPKEKQQKALPVCVYHLILASPATELQRSIAELAAAAHF